MNCGCGKKLGFHFYLVYEDAQPHCKECFEDAIDSTVPVLVRKTDALDYRIERGQTA